MPSYDLKCGRCATEFNVVRPVTEYNEPAPCPNCKKERPVSVLLSATPGKVSGGTPRFHR